MKNGEATNKYKKTDLTIDGGGNFNHQPGSFQRELISEIFPDIC